jgi:bifunctional DNase/RNase
MADLTRSRNPSRRRTTAARDTRHDGVPPPLTVCYSALHDPGLAAQPEKAVPVQMQLRRIIISEVDEHQVIVLKEVDGERSFPIVIGIFEATSIHRRVTGVVSPRPLTHDLITAVIEQLGGEIQDIVISDLEDHTYFAKLRVRKDGELIEIDCRPSDGIALAVTARVPIYVNEHVLGEALEDGE